MWNLPFNAHRMFIESLGGTHAQVMIYTRYINFLQSIRKSNKLGVIYLLEKVHLDLDTMTGQNIRHILDQINEKEIFKVKSRELKRKFKFKELPKEQQWKVNMMKEITDIKHNVVVLSSEDQNELDDHQDKNNFTVDELNEILSFIATS